MMTQPPLSSRVARSCSTFTVLVAAGLLAACSSPSTTSSTASIAPSESGTAPLADARSRGVEQGPALVDRLIAYAQRDNQVQEHLRTLCFDIGPRLTSSHNLERAQQWALEQFREWGLEAHLEEWGEFAVGFDRGPHRGGIVAPVQEDFDFATMAWTPGTNGPRRGRAVLRPETDEELAAVAEQLPGAWLVRKSAPPSRRNPDEGEDKRPPKEVRDRVDAAIKAAGIAGEVRRGFSGTPDRVLTGGNHKIEWDKLPTDVSVTLRRDQFEALVKRLDAKEDVELEFDIDNRFVQGPIKQYNVIADLVGTEKPDEVVLVGGHLDSWDGAQGAVDNGTGVATTLEAARLLMAVGARPKRTIRFALWSGEEQGLYGSEGYVKTHADDLEKISAVFIHDGGTNYLSGLTVTPEMEAVMRAACAPVIGLAADMPFELQLNDGLINHGDSDHAPFLDKGVPGFFWEQDGRSDYDHMHHTQFDTFDAAIPEYQRHSAVVAAVVAYDVANLDGLLDRRNMKPIPQRRMGVQLDGAKLSSVSKGGKAEKAGWKAGDVVLSIDGVAVADQKSIQRELQKGGARKVVIVRRGEETIETVLDYSGSKDEEEREARRLAREGKTTLDLSKFR